MLRSFPTRLSRAVVGVLSMWCLGCTSLDILIDRLVHGNVPMSECAKADDAPAQSGTDGAPSVKTSADDPMLGGCGCDHCIAVQTPATTLAAVQHPTPETVEHKPGSALSVAREPLVPPPIARTLA